MRDFGLLALKESTRYTKKGGEGVPVTVRVRPEVKNFIESKASELGISVSNYIDLYFVEEISKPSVEVDDDDGVEICEEL